MAPPPGDDTMTAAVTYAKQLCNRPGANQVRLVLAVVMAIFTFSWLGSSLKKVGAPPEVQLHVEHRTKLPHIVGSSPGGGGSAGGGAAGVTHDGKQTMTVVCAEYCAAAAEKGAFGLDDDEWVDEKTDDDFVRSQADLFRNWDSLLDRESLVAIVKHKKEMYLTQLEKDYGKEYFKKIFVASGEDLAKFPHLNKGGTGAAYLPYIPANTEKGKSEHMLRRKLKIKILSAQIGMKVHAEIVAKCKCATRRDLKSSLVSGHRRRIQQSDSTGLYETYVWATGGHSASAGHGNLYNESYTAVMESHVQPVFEAIGIHFEARNYAMGGTGSAPEMSMCFKEIYGDDVDIFSWDFGMMEGRYTQRLLNYGYRGGIQHGRGAFVGICLDDGQKAAADLLEDMGVPVFYGPSEMCTNMRNGIPESAGLKTDEIDALPKFVRNMKCDGGIENGEPFCGQEKYTMEPCGERPGHASWHPGWKEHAMTGNGIALFLIDMLLSAAEEIAQETNHDEVTLLQLLQSEDDEDYHSLLNAPLPDLAKNLYRYDFKDPDPEEDVPLAERQATKYDYLRTALFSERNICHTARLPARTRYLGYLMNTSQIGDLAAAGQEEYFVGIDEKTASETATSNGEVRIAYIASDRNICPVVPVSPDYKDVFFVGHLDGWVLLSIPNPAEKEAYVMKDTDFLGTIIIVPRGCDWGNCEAGFLRPDALMEGKFEMKVNGVPVTRCVPVDNGDGWVLEYAEGTRFGVNPDGGYNLKIKVNEASSFLKISSFVLF